MAAVNSLPLGADPDLRAHRGKQQDNRRLTRMTPAPSSLGPAMRQQYVDVACRVGRPTRKHVSDARVQIVSVETGRLDQTHDGRYRPRHRAGAPWRCERRALARKRHHFQVHFFEGPAPRDSSSGIDLSLCGGCASPLDSDVIRRHVSLVSGRHVDWRAASQIDSPPRHGRRGTSIPSRP